MPFPIESAISAGGSVIQGIIDAAQSKRNTERTIEANKQMADYQYSKDLDMWNKGNAYNAPLAQMARLKSAGLNPNLVYGSGTVAGQSAQQLPKYNAPTLDYSHNLPVQVGKGADQIAQHQNLRIQQAQIDNLNAQRHATYAETEIKKLEAIKRMNENQYGPEFLQQRNALLRGKVEGQFPYNQTLQQKFEQEFFRNSKKEELYNTQLSALQAGTRAKQVAMDRMQRLLPLEEAQRRMATTYAEARLNQQRKQTANFDTEMVQRLLHGSYANDLLIQQAESKRLENETFYTRMYGTAGLNILKGVNELKKFPIPSLRRKASSPQANSPSQYQRRGYGARKP